MSVERPPDGQLGPDAQMRALAAISLVAAEYGIPKSGLKPCIAYLLDGNVGHAALSESGFVIAMEMRRLGFTEAETERLLNRWGKKVHAKTRITRSAIKSAWRKDSAGNWHYHPPGLRKKPGRVYDRVLSAICAEVECPMKCGAFAGTHRGPRGEDLKRFEQLGWPIALRKQRHAAAADYYKAICVLETRHGLGAGAELRTSYKQLAEIAGRDPRHAGDNLRVLYTRGLLAEFERGRGSGPKARDRQPTRIKRRVPIPTPPSRYEPQ